jgi:hypothetical protein
MKRLIAAVAVLVLIAAIPEEALPGLEADGYYIEDGSSVSEQVVSDAVFDGRADGGRLYIVVLAEEPPGGAPTFSDSMLDLLDGDGYVVTVAPASVGFAGDGTFWSRDELNTAIEASLGGGSDDEVVQIFIDTLTNDSSGGEIGDGQSDTSDGGGFPLFWILLVGGGAMLLWWWFVNNRNASTRTARRMAEVKELANTKLAEVANDILEMEDEVSVSDNAEVKEHYQRASVMYAQAMEETETATSIAEMLEVSGELDLAIWELDCAEALLDGKPKPPRPEPPKVEPAVSPTPAEAQGLPTSVPPAPDFDRRPQRQSGGSNDMLSMLLTMMAMGGMRQGGGFGGASGGWTGSGGGAPRPPMGGFGGRIRGGGRRR